MSRENLEKEGITLLGNQNVRYPDNYAPEVLETFLNKHPDNDYFVKFNCPEFTSLCPITGQPDFATITISYVPGEKMVESKSLKLYLFSFRNHGDFHEDCVNIIMKDLIKLMDPKYIEVWGKFTPRGGISIDPYCNYGKPGTRWEEVAWNRMANHDLYPEKTQIMSVSPSKVICRTQFLPIEGNLILYSFSVFSTLTIDIVLLFGTYQPESAATQILLSAAKSRE